MSATRTLVITISIFLHMLCKQIQGLQKCGQIITRPSSAKLEGKITSGYEVGYYKYPWFAAMQIDDDTICGGALIAHNIVMTAAHCYNEARGSKLEAYFKVKLGLYRQCRKEPTQTTYTVSKVWIHEKYHTMNPYFDIALVKLSGSTEAYMPICLPPKILNDVDQEMEGWIIGFGSKIENNENSYPCEMNEGRVLIYDNATCKAMVKKLSDEPSYSRYLRALCAGYKTGGVDSCQGDSGGPLMTYDSINKTWQSVGITAFGWGCGRKNQMGIYTDVSRFLDWIEEKTGVKPTDYQNPVSNIDNNPNDVGTSSNTIVDAFIKIFDHVMNSEHRPSEITIRFKDKPHAQNVTQNVKMRRKLEAKSYSKTKGSPGQEKRHKNRVKQ